jgi:hypothetical protein
MSIDDYTAIRAYPPLIAVARRELNSDRAAAFNIVRRSEFFACAAIY